MLEVDGQFTVPYASDRSPLCTVPFIVAETARMSVFSQPLTEQDAFILDCSKIYVRKDTGIRIFQTVIKLVTL